MNFKCTPFWLLLLCYLISTGCDTQQPESDAILNENLFLNPPQEFQPKTWFHVMSGNMSKEGLTKDLEAIKEVGIGGILVFSVSHSIPKGNVLFNSLEHQELLKFAAIECERLGLSFGLHNCDGWTSSGGPWVTPDQSMKMVVWSEIYSHGGKLDTVLPQPTTREGIYQDIAVLAYPTLSIEKSESTLTSSIASSDPTFDVSLAMDGRWDQSSVFHSSEDKDFQNHLIIDFGQEKEINSFYMSLTKTISGSRQLTLLSSKNGRNFEMVNTYQLKRLGKREFAVDEPIPGIKARYFKIIPEDDYEIMEIQLQSRPRFQQFLAKTSMFKVEDHRLPTVPQIPTDEIILKKDILNLSASLDSEGILNVALPSGDWTIVRFGYTSVGAINSPASAEGQGLEVDKMDKEALKTHYDSFVGKIFKLSKDDAPNAFQYLEIDSYEVGGQNWTNGYLEVFSDRYQYDLIPFLLAYTGRVIESPKTIDDVLWDIRNLNSDLITENYFGHFTELTHEDGLIAYIEPYSFNAAFNEMDAGKYPDITMGEFWMHQRYQCGTAVSSGRIYGKKIISAESFSARPEINWRGHPGLAKTTGDQAWILGINEFMFHRYAHQANTHAIPGMTMSQWGSHLNRNQTWWKSAGREWFKYISRGSYLLRQGNPVSDLLVYVGEGTPNSVKDRREIKPDLPVSINFDNINTDALLNRISVKDQTLALPDGTAYKMILLTDIRRISLEVLEKIKIIAENGVTIIGKKPEMLAKYRPSPEEEEKFRDLVKSIWRSPQTFEKVDWMDLYKRNNWDLDMEVSNHELSYIHRQNEKEEIYFFYNSDSTYHNFECKFRTTGKRPEFWNPMTGSITKPAFYYTENEQTVVNVPLPSDASVFVVFREADDTNMAIRKITAKSSLPGVFYDDNNQISGRFRYPGEYSFTFSDQTIREKSIQNLPDPINMDGPWSIDFDAIYGYQNRLKGVALFDWKDAEDFDIRHYSGTAHYTTTFNVTDQWLTDSIKAYLDLGDVQQSAILQINGKLVGTFWKAPYVAEISQFLSPGTNELSVQVTNTWTNRLIGDEYFPRTDGYEIGTAGQSNNKMPNWYTANQPMPAGERKLFSAYPFYKKDDDLMSSGLIGPVKIQFEIVRKI